MSKPILYGTITNIEGSTVHFDCPYEDNIMTASLELDNTDISNLKIGQEVTIYAEDIKWNFINQKIT